MPVRKRLTDQGLRRLRPPKDRAYVDHYDSIIPRLMLSIYKSGRKAWHIQYYVGGKVRCKKLGEHPALGVRQARDLARKFAEDPTGALAKAETGTFGEIAEQFLKRHVEANKLRSSGDIKRSIGHALKRWKHREFLSIRRRDVAQLLDQIEDERGPGVATAVLVNVRKLMRWFEARSDDFVSPIVPGMQRATAKARCRVLDDDEVRALWSATDSMPIFGDFVKLLLLTGQRRAKVATVKWDDIDFETGVWTIATEPREKGNPGALKLPEMALEIIRKQPRIFANAFVFPARGRANAICGFNKRKLSLDQRLPADMPPWCLHDLRRIARSLLSRAGVRPDISERVLGHAIGGVEGVYDRHRYGDEKADALNCLAALLTNILRGPEADNVIPLAQRGAAN